MRHVAFLLLVVACGAESKPQAAAPAPTPAPIVAPTPAPKAEPVESAPSAASGTGSGVLVARGGDPCEGGEIAQSGGLGPPGAGAGGGGAGGTALGTRGMKPGGMGLGYETSGQLGGKHTPSPAIRYGVAEVMGALDRDVVRGVVVSHKNQIEACYKHQLATDPNLGGTLVLQFQISKEGRVATAFTKGLSDQMETCTFKVVRDMVFPPPKGGIVIVNLPLTFTPS
jgi:hypothetical protein